MWLGPRESGLADLKAAGIAERWAIPPLYKLALSISARQGRYAGIVQLVEHSTDNREVTGSTPVSRTKGKNVPIGVG